MADRITTKPHLHIVSNEPRDRGMRADVALDHRYRARRTGQSPVEYANAIERYQRPTSRSTSWALYAAVTVLAALALAASAGLFWRVG